MFEIAQLEWGYLQLQAIEIVVLLLLLADELNGFTFYRGLIDGGQDAQT